MYRASNKQNSNGLTKCALPKIDKSSHDYYSVLHSSKRKLLVLHDSCKYMVDFESIRKLLVDLLYKID